MTRNLLPLAAVFSILCVVAQASPRSCRIVFPERPNNSPKTAYLFDGSKSIPVTLPSMNLSEVIELPAGDLTIAMTAQEINDPKLLPPGSPVLRIPEAITDFYIIITPEPKNTTIPVHMNLVDSGAGKLKPGETLWYNYTGHRIAAKLGEAEMSIDPNSRTISKGAMADSGYYKAQFIYQAGGKGPFAPITEQMWWHDAKCKHLGFIVSTGGKLPKIYYFRDFRLPKEAIKAAEAAEAAAATE